MRLSRIVHVNGGYVPEEEARISVFDRGFLFADGVYEVTSVLGGRLVDFPALANGRPIWLCWKLGEDDIAWWHELEAGVAGRRPLIDLE